jgi:hypothetical protein
MRDMNKFKFVRGKDGNIVGSTTTNNATGITIVRNRHGNVVGYGDERRRQTRGKDGNLLHWDGDPSFLLR